MHISEQLERLERTNRRWRLAAFGLLATLAVIGCAGAVAPSTTSDLTRTRRFELVDDSGRARIEMGTNETGITTIRILDHRGRPRIAMGTLGIGPSAGSAGIGVVDVAANRQTCIWPGHVSIERDGKRQVGLGCGEEHLGGLVDVYNTFGKRVATVQSTKGNAGMIAVYDLNGGLAHGMLGDR